MKTSYFYTVRKMFSIVGKHVRISRLLYKYFGSNILQRKPLDGQYCSKEPTDRTSTVKLRNRGNRTKRRIFEFRRDKSISFRRVTRKFVVLTTTTTSATLYRANPKTTAKKIEPLIVHAIRTLKFCIPGNVSQP